MEKQSIKKITNLVKPFLTESEQKDIDVAQMEHTYQGPICDNHGFSQHKGECWNDTLQEIFLFSDGLKEITQPLIYNLNTDTKILSELITTKLFPDTPILNDKDTNTVNKLVKYIILMKIRFITHYNFVIATKIHNRSILSKMYKSKRRYSSACGVGSAKHIINLYHGNSIIYKPGLTYVLKNELMNNLFKIFGINYVVAPYKSSDLLTNINAISISSNLLKLKDLNTYKYKGAHAFGFLKCNDQWKYYDDNERSGLINIDDKLVSLYINENNIAIIVDNNDNTIHLIKYKPYEETANKDSIITFIEQYYDIDSNSWKDWDIEWNNTKDFNRIYTKSEIFVIRPRVKWSAFKERSKGTLKGGNNYRNKTLKMRKAKGKW